MLRRLVARAGAGNLDLVSLMVMLESRGAWERLLIPAFVFFFQKLYPFSWVNDSKRATAAAAGGCMLVRRQALERAGGIGAIRDRIIDDCALARIIKAGGSIWLGLTEESRSLRAYTGLAELWNMVARTAFMQLRHSAVLLLLTVAGMGLIYLAPPATLAVGVITWRADLAFLGAAAYGLMMVAYRPTLKLYRQSPWRGMLLPLAGLLYTLMTVDSAFRHWRGRGGGWKGRHYGPSAGKGD